MGERSGRDVPSRSAGEGGGRREEGFARGRRPHKRRGTLGRTVFSSAVPCRACRRDGGALQQGGDPRPSEEAHRVGPGAGQRREEEVGDAVSGDSARPGRETRTQTGSCHPSA